MSRDSFSSSFAIECSPGGMVTAAAAVAGHMQVIERLNGDKNDSPEPWINLPSFVMVRYYGWDGIHCVRNSLMQMGTACVGHYTRRNIVGMLVGFACRRL